MAGVPSRFREGMLVLSGDVLLLFNPLQIDAQFHGAAAISMKSPVDVGKDHGVFLNNGKDYVKKFLHKLDSCSLFYLEFFELALFCSYYAYSSNINKDEHETS